MTNINARMDLLRCVNADVNDSITYMTDQQNYHVLEYWAEVKMKEGFGDCEDFALTKMRKLISLGFPLDQMWLQLCFTETREGHAVLRAQIDGVDWVLDNRSTEILTPQDLFDEGYRFTEHCRADGWSPDGNPAHRWQWSKIEPA